MKIDFHNHYYPPEYLEAVKQGPTKVRMDYDAEGNPRLHYPGDYNILVPGHRDLVADLVDGLTALQAARVSSSIAVG